MKFILFIFSLIFATSLFGQNIDKYDAIADSFYSTGQREKILPYFLKEYKSKPKNEKILRTLGFYYIEENNLELGEKFYNEALAVNPKCARCYMNLARIYARKENHQKALDLLNKAISIDPNDASIYSTRGKLKEITGDLLDAYMDFNKAVTIEPKNPNHYMDRARYNSHQGYYALAISDMNKAVELAPENIEPYLERASIYYSTKMYDEALSDISKAMKIDSNRFELYNGRGAIYAAKKEQKKAIADYERAIKLNPDDYLAYYNLSRETYEQEDMEGYCTQINKSYQLLNRQDPSHPINKELENSINVICDSNKASYYYQRGIAFFNLQEYEKAIAIYTKGLQKFPRNAMTLSFRGNAYFMKKDYKNALADYYASIQNKANVTDDIKANQAHIGFKDDYIETYLKGFLASMYYHIAESKFALGDYNEALAEIEKGISIAPDVEDFGRENYYNVRGNIYLALNKNPQAINDFNKCLQLNPNYAIAYVNRAIAKVNMANKVKMASYYISGGTNNQAFNANWTMPVKASVKKSDENIASALADCNIAIETDPNLNYAYYIRGQLKKALVYSDFCTDFLKAKALGYPVEIEFLSSCK